MSNYNYHTKMCEICSSNSNSWFHRVVSDIDYQIHLENPQIEDIDRNNLVVTMEDGSHIDYNVELEYGKLAVNLLGCSLHIFCSDDCEDKFLSKYAPTMRNDVYREHPLVQWKDVFVPCILESKAVIREEDWEECDFCGEEHPNSRKSQYDHIKKYISYETLERSTVAGVHGGSTSHIDLQKYPICISDISQKSPNGTYYLYSIDRSSKETKLFCSKECVFHFSEREDSPITFLNYLEKNCLGITTRDTKKINNNLGNKYIYRFTKLKQN